MGEIFFGGKNSSKPFFLLKGQKDFVGVRNTYFDIFLMINDQGNPKSHPENPLIWLLKNLILPKTPKNY